MAGVFKVCSTRGSGYRLVVHIRLEHCYLFFFCITANICFQFRMQMSLVPCAINHSIVTHPLAGPFLSCGTNCGASLRGEGRWQKKIITLSCLRRTEISWKYQNVTIFDVDSAQKPRTATAIYTILYIGVFASISKLSRNFRLFGFRWLADFCFIKSAKEHVDLISGAQRGGQVGGNCRIQCLGTQAHSTP